MFTVEGWGYNSVVNHMLGMLKTRGSISPKKRREKRARVVTE
jgi:hypothetical protein